MTFFHSVVDFFNHPVFIIIGGITVVLGFIGVVYRIGCLIFGITPLVIRISSAIWKRRIAVFGNLVAYSSLQTSLVDSKIFREKNIFHVPLNNLDKGKECSLYLIDWESANTKIHEILTSRKNQHTAVIIYAKAGSIPQDKMGEIANSENTVVVNFRGRLLNDLLNSMITTSFDGR